ncbi:MAG TPA: hypothetical protein PLH94_14650 [Fimbriimonadaceae bacterium]|nr:hypothetical protein [Fimbriimonadaceae bacterium]
MNLQDIASLLVGIGVGGALGAVAALVLAGSRLAESATTFSAQLRDYLRGRSDPDSRALAEAFEDLDARLQTLLATLQRVRRALRWKS